MQLLRGAARTLRSLVGGTAPDHLPNGESPTAGPDAPSDADDRDAVATAFSDVATEDDIRYCFRLLLGRAPSPAEWVGHVGGVGHPLREVVSTYLGSLEFTNRRLLTPPVAALELVQLPGFRMYVMSSDVVIGRQIVACGSYEPAVTRAVQATLRPGMTFVDLGANVGYFSLLAASCVGASGAVFAFEPAPNNVKLMHLNRTLNGFENIRVFPLAAGTGWSLDFYDAAGSNGWVSPIASTPDDVMARTVVASADVSNVLPPDRHIDMIKVDVEGAEYLALTGARPTIERDHPVIVSELTPPALEAISHVSAEDYLRFLVDLGYRLSVLRQDATVACATDIARVIALYEEFGEDHVDVLAE